MRSTRQEWLLRKVKELQEFVVTDQDTVEQSLLLRNQAIRSALGAGVKQADIARITGLSRERVRQLR